MLKNYFFKIFNLKIFINIAHQYEVVETVKNQIDIAKTERNDRSVTIKYGCGLEDEASR